MLFHDCSNSTKRPLHRGSGGPIENDCIRLIKRDATQWGWNHTDSLNDADILLTNDVWPEYALKSGKPLVKRMDGRFWEENLQDRNTAYDEAARQSTCVVFISPYSFECAKHILKNQKVFIATNAADPSVFYPSNAHTKTIISAATDWSRSEKRGSAILEVAENLPEYQFVMVGTNCRNTPKNVQPLGYINQELLADHFRNSGLLLNLSYRDAAPKTVAQGSACGLNVVYANSGGTGSVSPQLAYQSKILMSHITIIHRH